jgi:hypothetical protein
MSNPYGGACRLEAALDLKVATGIGDGVAVQVELDGF